MTNEEVINLYKAEIRKLENKNSKLRHERNCAVKQFAELLHDQVTDVGVHSAIDCVATEMTSNNKLIREAYWYINPDGYYPQCSNCWEEPKSGDLTPYCPNCGSKMAKETR